MLNWIAWWHHPGDTDDDRDVAQQLADMAVSSVLEPDADETEPGPDRIIAGMRQNLDYLEQSLRVEE